MSECRSCLGTGNRQNQAGADYACPDCGGSGEISTPLIRLWWAWFWGCAKGATTHELGRRNAVGFDHTRQLPPGSAVMNVYGWGSQDTHYLKSGGLAVRRNADGYPNLFFVELETPYPVDVVESVL